MTPSKWCRLSGKLEGCSIDEVARVMAHLGGDKWLIAMLLYGGGLRLLEALRLRVKDLDFERGEITVREGKADKDRVTMLPRAAIPHLQEHLGRVQAIHQQNLADGYDIRTVQELLGHGDVRTTMIYAHVLTRGGRTGSPLRR
jgi:site-specific recombinase XerD